MYNDWASVCWSKYDDMLSCFSTIAVPERDRQTDGQNCYINIADQHCCAGAR